MPGGGIEPPQGICPYQILSLTRLPFRHPGLIEDLGWHTGFEPATSASTGQRSAIELMPPGASGVIRTPNLVVRTDLLYPLSYGGPKERDTGVEPVYSAWKADVGPLN